PGLNTPGGDVRGRNDEIPVIRTGISSAPPTRIECATFGTGNPIWVGRRSTSCSQLRASKGRFGASLVMAPQRSVDGVTDRAPYLLEGFEVGETLRCEGVILARSAFV